MRERETYTYTYTCTYIYVYTTTDIKDSCLWTKRLKVWALRVSQNRGTLGTPGLHREDQRIMGGPH